MNKPDSNIMKIAKAALIVFAVFAFIFAATFATFYFVGGIN